MISYNSISFLVRLTCFTFAIGFSIAVPELRAKRATAMRGKIWESPVIQVCFENSRPQNYKLAREAVQGTWEAHSSLKFVGWGICADNSKGIRISTLDEAGSTKDLGSGLDGLKNGMNLNFQFQNYNSACQNTMEECIKWASVHEFGHGIGLAHEQNRDEAPQWCKDKAGDTVVGNWKVSAYDKSSVMNYCCTDAQCSNVDPSTWSVEKILSDLDKETAELLYPSKELEHAKAEFPTHPTDNSKFLDECYTWGNQCSVNDDGRTANEYCKLGGFEYAEDWKVSTDTEKFYGKTKMLGDNADCGEHACKGFDYIWCAKRKS